MTVPFCDDDHYTDVFFVCVFVFVVSCALSLAAYLPPAALHCTTLHCIALHFISPTPNSRNLYEFYFADDAFRASWLGASCACVRQPRSFSFRVASMFHSCLLIRIHHMPCRAVPSSADFNETVAPLASVRCLAPVESSRLPASAATSLNLSAMAVNDVVDLRPSVRQIALLNVTAARLAELDGRSSSSALRARVRWRARIATDRKAALAQTLLSRCSFAASRDSRCQSWPASSSAKRADSNIAFCWTKRAVAWCARARVSCVWST